MATYAATSHGGDGGDRPPHGHSTHIPADCESSQPKRVRGRGKNLNMLEKFAKNGHKPLPLEIDPTGETFKFVGEHGSYFIRFITSCVEKVPPQYPSWDKVPEEFKRSVFRELHNYFDLRSWNSRREWQGIRVGINEDCARRYRDRKATLKRHFDKKGGYEDVEKAKRHPHPTLNAEQWARLIDELYLEPSYRARALQNAINRSKQPYSCRSGSKSYAQRRYEDVQQTGSMQLLEGWRDMHTSNGSWVNDSAAQDWTKIQQELQIMVEEAGGGPVDEKEVLRRALGERRGWSRGVGRKVRNIPPDVACVTDPQMNDLEERIRVLKRQMRAGKSNEGTGEDENEDEDEDN